MDDAIVIDLFNLIEVQLMKETMPVVVGGGCYLKDIDNTLAADNLGVTLGTYLPTGIGGLVTTAGGVGHSGRLFGLACDKIIAAEVVTFSRWRDSNRDGLQILYRSPVGHPWLRQRSRRRLWNRYEVHPPGVLSTP
jgi:FAD/FMN-containing dehydrogenase